MATVTNGETVTLRALIVEARDSGNIRVAIGGREVLLSAAQIEEALVEEVAPGVEMTAGEVRQRARDWLEGAQRETSPREPADPGQAP